MKNKILTFLMILISCMFLVSCDLTNGTTPDNNQNNDNNNNNNNNNENIIDGVDISKYEKPQTGFMYDGHTLTKLEEMMKYVIENGEFVFDYYSDGIGYKLMLENPSSDVSRYAFYCVDTLRIVDLKVSGKTYEISYIKLNDQEGQFQISHKIIYNSWRQDFYAIMNCNKQTFNKEFIGEYELYRGYVKVEQSEITSKLVSSVDNLLTLFTNLTKENINLSLSDIGYQNYK